ncbi:Type IV secretion system protein VirB6 [Candidatus Phycorickettsia trachydisci]|uniref:Type IV secretion system protein VirB6 n=1 Tax=Candidatus Phycorickettsia trachydisci TaxID=2115978 RepID=A0A2P1P8E8_9RICK|nr:type IV secretion system protein [Candidatus Phycorickettsia trachydisci]AVP87537.1 Type IV secretion system protein VirB6 [Candidatus Phycorickettsia trachydisci]
MQKYINKIFGLLIICLMYLPLAHGACSNYTNIASTIDQTYLKAKTPYGYVYNSLNILGSPCSASDTQMQLYVYNDSTYTSSNTTKYTFNVGQQVPLNTLGSLFTQSIFSNISLRADLHKETNQLCLIMDTIYGDLPLTCQPTATDFKANTNTANNTSPLACFQSDACTFSLGNSHSKVLMSITGLMVECVRDSLNNLFFMPGLCVNNGSLNSFYQVTDYLRKTIGALLTLYVIGYGIKLLSSHGFQDGQYSFNFSWGDAIMRVIKMLLVVYFTVGVNVFSVFNTNISKNLQNGMIDIALPLLQKTTTDLASIVFSAGRSNVNGGLCQFDPATYPDGYTYYALFDAIDCRIGYYLGYGLIYNSMPASTRTSPNTFAIFKVITAFLSSNLILVVFNVFFIYVFLNVLLVTFVGTFIVYSVMIAVMVFISPLIIPLVLFEKTKNSFNEWFKMTLSFALQPGIMSVFIAVMFMVYDQAIYGDCIFTQSTYPLGTARTVVTYDISSTNTVTCSKSVGWKLYQLYTDSTYWHTKSGLFWSTDVVKTDYTFTLASFKLAIISFVIYKVAMAAQGFAANVTGGLSIPLGGSGGGAQGGASQGGGGGGAKDKASAQNKEGASDKIGTKGGGGAPPMRGGAADKLT